jgi:hypothetical protein
MFEKNSRLNPLELRKELLLAKSELNRVQMLADMAGLSADIRALSDRARSFDSIASSAAVLMSGLGAFRRGKPADGDAKPSWLRTVLKSAGLVSNLWLALRPKGRHRKAD